MARVDGYGLARFATRRRVPPRRLVVGRIAIHGYRVDARCRQARHRRGGDEAYRRPAALRSRELRVLRAGLAAPANGVASLAHAACRHQARAHVPVRRLADRPCGQSQDGARVPRGSLAYRRGVRRTLPRLAKLGQHRRARHLPRGPLCARHVRRAARGATAGAGRREPIRLGLCGQGRPRGAGGGDRRPLREHRIVAARLPGLALAQRARVLGPAAAVRARGAAQRLPAGIPSELPDDARDAGRRAARGPPQDQPVVPMVGRRAVVARLRTWRSPTRSAACW